MLPGSSARAASPSAFFDTSYRQVLRPLDLEDLIDVGYALEISLRLWSRMAQLALSTKYVTVEACNPPASARGNIEITDSGLDVR